MKPKNPLITNKENQKIRNITSPNTKKQFQSILNDIPLQLNNKIYIHRGSELEIASKKTIPRRQSSLVPINMRNQENSKYFLDEKLKNDKNVYEKAQSQKNNRRTLIIRKAKSPNPNCFSKTDHYLFYNETELIKENKSRKNQFKQLTILHFETLGKIIKKNSGQVSFFLTMEFDEFIEHLVNTSIIAIIISDIEHRKEIIELLDRRGSKYHYIFQIKNNKGHIKEGNIVLNYSSLFRNDIIYENIEEVMIFQTYNKNKINDMEKENRIEDLKCLRFFENKLIYFERFENKQLKTVYLDENAFHNARILTLYKNNAFDTISPQIFHKMFSIYREKHLRKSKEMEFLQKIQVFKKTISFNAPKNLEEIFSKKQIQLRKTFFDYLVELKKIPKMKNLVIGPVIGSLLERNSHILKHILKIQIEKEEPLKKISEMVTKLKTDSEDFQKNERTQFQNLENFLNLYYS